MINRLLLAVGLVIVGASSCIKPANVLDAGSDEDPVEFEGEAMNGTIPVLEPETEFNQPDANEFTVDKRCCNLRFSIAHQDDALAVGAIYGNYSPFDRDGGLPLTRDGGEWTAAACFPLNTSAEYAYVFTAPGDGGADDAGTDGDGGFVAAPPNVTVRYSDREEFRSDGMGGFVNFVPSVPDCAGLDASTGMLP